MTDNIAAFTVPPVVKTITVKCAPERAFRAFTAEAASWWPLASHSIGKGAESCFIEQRVGGRVYQRAGDGSEAEWGRVLVWEPPRRFAFSWRVLLAPEHEQRVEIDFAPVAGGTQVRLTHSGWEKLGPTAEERRRAYEQGWGTVFEQCYGRYADSAP